MPNVPKQVYFSASPLQFAAALKILICFLSPKSFSSAWFRSFHALRFRSICNAALLSGPRHARFPRINPLLAPRFRRICPPSGRTGNPASLPGGRFCSFRRCGIPNCLYSKNTFPDFKFGFVTIFAGQKCRQNLSLLLRHYPAGCISAALNDQLRANVMSPLCGSDNSRRLRDLTRLLPASTPTSRSAVSQVNDPARQ